MLYIRNILRRFGHSNLRVRQTFIQSTCTEFTFADTRSNVQRWFATKTDIEAIHYIETLQPDERVPEEILYRIGYRAQWSSFRGVVWDMKKARWRAYVIVVHPEKEKTTSGRSRQKIIGYFSTAEDAARAHDDASVKLNGEYAQLNFPHASGIGKVVRKTRQYTRYFGVKHLNSRAREGKPKWYVKDISGRNFFFETEQEAAEYYDFLLSIGRVDLGRDDHRSAVRHVRKLEEIEHHTSETEDDVISDRFDPKILAELGLTDELVNDTHTGATNSLLDDDFSEEQTDAETHTEQTDTATAHASTFEAITSEYTTNRRDIKRALLQGPQKSDELQTDPQNNSHKNANELQTDSQNNSHKNANELQTDSQNNSHTNASQSAYCNDRGLETCSEEDNTTPRRTEIDDMSLIQMGVLPNFPTKRQLEVWMEITEAQKKKPRTAAPSGLPRMQRKYIHTPYIGVEQRDVGTIRYRARLGHAGRRYSLGMFATAQEAARARDLKYIEVFGLSGQPRLNFPVHEYKQELMQMVEDGHLTAQEVDNALSGETPPATGRVKKSSSFIGVTFHPDRVKAQWRARLCHNGRILLLGYFGTELEAARARDMRAAELGVSTSKLNFPISFYNSEEFLSQMAREQARLERTESSKGTSRHSARGSSSGVESGSDASDSDIKHKHVVVER